MYKELVSTLLIFSFLCPIYVAKAAVYYVDKENKFGNSCSNSWSGSIAQPKCDFTSNWFQHGLEPGDEVIVREAPIVGYGEARLYEDSTGEIDNPIVIRAYEGEKINIKTGSQHSIRLIGDTSYITFKDFNISSREYSFVAESQVDGNYGIKLQDSEIYNTNQGPRFFNFHDSEIRNCEIHDLSVNGVQLRYASNIIIDNVNVTRINDGRSPGNSDADGFHTYGGENIVISNSTSTYNAEDGFDLNANATLINVKSAHNNGAGMKIWRRMEDGYLDKTVTVINSIFNNNGYYAPNPNDGNPGIKVSDGAALNLYNSVVYGNYDQGVRIRAYANDGSYLAGLPFLPSVIKNTVIAGTIDGPGLDDSWNCTWDVNNIQENPHCTSIAHLTTESNNLYFDNFGGDATGYNLNGVAGDLSLTNPVKINPSFINASSDDFNITLGSSAINTGIDLSSLGISSLSSDIVGTTRPQGPAWDIGVYEYQNQIRGDVDNNSATNTTDALLTLRNSLGLSMTSTAWQASATTGDVDCNGTSNSTDALLILRYSLGLNMGSTAWCE